MFSRAKEPSEQVAPQSSSHSDKLWERLLAPVRSSRTLTIKSTVFIVSGLMVMVMMMVMRMMTATISMLVGLALGLMVMRMMTTTTTFLT